MKSVVLEKIGEDDAKELILYIFERILLISKNSPDAGIKTVNNEETILAA